MPLTAPKLDDRNFDQLVSDAKLVIDRLCPAWSDRSPSDPGMVLIEVFAHLTDVMLYRLNRMPVSAYIEFLRLIGLTLQPPAAATVRLRFSREQATTTIEIPRGTRVSTARGGSDAPVFTTLAALPLAAGATSGEVLACHCESIQGELAGVATGLPAFRVTARRPPIIAPMGDELELMVGVELEAGESESGSVIAFDGRAYRIWREVSSFAETSGDPYVYVADRMAGTITFAPEVRLLDTAAGATQALDSRGKALAAIPPAGKQIRLWYRRGGGAEGNVVAGALTVMKDSIAGVTVTNPTPATGGRVAESVENAMLRGPQELHSPERAVTARDFEHVAIRSSGAIARASSFTSVDLWKHASPGHVDVLLVPFVPEEQRSGGVSEALVARYATDDALTRAQAALDERRPLGTKVRASWVRCKPVRVEARVVIRRGEDAARIRGRLLDRINSVITPLPSKTSAAGWRFGDPLRIGQIYDLLLAEPGVRYADGVKLVVDRMPERNVLSIASDAFQPRTFYAAAGSSLFRTTDDGEGWESAATFDTGSAAIVKAHPAVPGYVAAIVAADDGKSSTIHVSCDCGESWREPVPIALSIDDAEWSRRDGIPLLLLATGQGLYELQIRDGAVPIQLLVDAANQDLGFYAVTTSTGVSGTVSVAVAARGTGGVYLSNDSGRAGSFRLIGLKGEDIRVLAVQSEGPNSFLWAGVAAPGEVGVGAYRARIWDSPDANSDWTAFKDGWDGGSCLSIVFRDSMVCAASHRAGVLWLDSSMQQPQWTTSPVSSGLPIQELSRFETVATIAANADWVLAGGEHGLFRATHPGGPYEECSSPIFTDKVTAPETWLFCAGDHQLDVVSEEQRR